jgi:hypothetical protein
VVKAVLKVTPLLVVVDVRVSPKAKFEVLLSQYKPLAVTFKVPLLPETKPVLRLPNTAPEYSGEGVGLALMLTMPVAKPLVKVPRPAYPIKPPTF